MSRAAIPTLIAVLAAALSSPAIARACTCSPPGNAIEVLPAEGMNAPRNTLIWVLTGSLVAAMAGVDVQLFDAEGNAVETDRSEIMGGSADGARLIVLVPRALLDPNADYTIDVAVNGGGPLLRRMPFHTSELIDREPPATPDVVGADVHAREPMPKLSCGGDESLLVTLKADAWVLKRDARNIPSVDPFDAEQLTGSIEDMRPHAGGGDATMFYGSDGCSFAPWHGFPAEMQFATLDLAGNFSGWSRTQHFAPRTAADCGVAGPGVEPPYRPLGPLLSVAALGLLAVRRARRGRRRER